MEISPNIKQLGGKDFGYHTFREIYILSYVCLQDRFDVLEDKVRFISKLLTSSRHTVLLTGAGVSTSAGCCPLTCS